jgi:hypothetical protein
MRRFEDAVRSREGASPTRFPGTNPVPKRKWGPASLPAPTAPSEGYAGVRNLIDRALRPTDPLSILAHQLRRRFPSCSSLSRGARLIYSTAPPEGSLVFRLARPGIGTEVPSKTARCSTALLGSTTLTSRFAHQIPRGDPGTASRLRKIDSSGASSRLAPKRTRKLSPIACRRRSDLWSPAAPFAVAGSGEAGTAVPIT